MEDPIRPLIREVRERYSEARDIGDEDGMRSACLDMYSVAFLQTNLTEGYLRIVANFIKQWYERGENPKVIRITKRLGKKLYLSLIAQKKVLSEYDGLTNKLLGLEQ